MEVWFLLGLGVVLIGLNWLVQRNTDDLTPQQRTEAGLGRYTDEWTKPLVVITYAGNRDGEEMYALHAGILAQHGYFPITQSTSVGGASAGHILAFGLAGLAARKGGSMVVTFRREA